MTGDEPIETRRCAVAELVNAGVWPGMVIRASDEDTAPWKRVKTINDGWFWEELPDRDPIRMDAVTVEFFDGTTRFLGTDVNEVEVGLLG